MRKRWIKATLVAFLSAGLLTGTMSSFSCVRLRGRPPVEKEPEPPVEIAEAAPVEERARPVIQGEVEMISVPVQQPPESPPVSYTHLRAHET